MLDVVKGWLPRLRAVGVPAEVEAALLFGAAPFSHLEASPSHPRSGSFCPGHRGATPLRSDIQCWIGKLGWVGCMRNVNKNGGEARARRPLTLNPKP